MATIHELIKPENKIELDLMDSDEFRRGCHYGKPRPGHPEGKVLYHIRDVLDNVDVYSSSDNRSDLRFVALVHDTFKYKVDRRKPRTGENHHGMIARRFAERYVETPRVLETIELHDEAFNSWQMGNRRGNWRGAENRARRLIERISGDLDFYLTFYTCDNETGDKSRDNLNWFRRLVSA